MKIMELTNRCSGAPVQVDQPPLVRPRLRVLQELKRLHRLIHRRLLLFAQLRHARQLRRARRRRRRHIAHRRAKLFGRQRGRCAHRVELVRCQCAAGCAELRVGDGVGGGRARRGDGAVGGVARADEGADEECLEGRAVGVVWPGGGVVGFGREARVLAGVGRVAGARDVGPAFVDLQTQ